MVVAFEIMSVEPSVGCSGIFLATLCLPDRDKEHVKLVNVHVKLGRGLRRDAFPACCLPYPAPAHVCPGFLHPAADCYRL
jgi:hypothetical protein